MWKISKSKVLKIQKKQIQYGPNWSSIEKKNVQIRSKVLFEIKNLTSLVPTSNKQFMM
jgi:hypothetical protein